MLKLNNILLFVILSNILFATDKNKVFNSLKEKFSKIDNIEFEFANYDMGVSGSFVGTKGNKYKIISNDRIIVSDAKTVWNYSGIDKQVIITNYKAIKSAGIENIFFDYFENLTPVELRQKRNSKGKNVSELVLIRKDNNEEIILSLSKENQIIGFEISKTKEYWEVSNLEINPPLSTTFKFTPPDSTETIDLR